MFSSVNKRNYLWWNFSHFVQTPVCGRSRRVRAPLRGCNANHITVILMSREPLCFLIFCPTLVFRLEGNQLSHLSGPLSANSIKPTAPEIKTEAIKQELPFEHIDSVVRRILQYVSTIYTHNITTEFRTDSKGF